MKVLIILFLILCSSCKGKNESEYITIAVPKTLSSLPFYELQLTKLHNKTLKVMFYNDHSIAMAEFFNNRYNLLVTGFSQAASVYKERGDFQVVSSFVWGNSSLLVNSPSFKNIYDLEGTRIALPFQGSPLDLQFSAIINAVSPKIHIRKSYSPFTQAAALAINNQIQGFLAPEPMATTLVSNKKLFRFAHLNDLWAEITGLDGKTPQVSIIGKTAYLQQEKKNIQAFCSQLETVITRLHTEPESFINSYHGTFDLSKELFAEALRNVKFSYKTGEKNYLLSTTYLNHVNEDYIPTVDFYYHDK